MSSLHSPSTTRRSAPSRRGRAGLATAAVLAVVLPLAAACGAGFDAAAENVKPDSGSGAVGALRVNNVWVVVDPSTGNAEIIGSVANTGGDATATLAGVQVEGNAAQLRAAADPTGTAASVDIPVGQAVSFGQSRQPEIELPASGLTVGNLAHVTFDFGTVGTVVITAQIQSNTGLWAEYDPNSAIVTPSPSPSAPASASASASSSASAGASSSASASASASASPTSSKK